MLARHAHYRAPLFGAFPLPPCIAGSAGQRLYNPDDAANNEPVGAGLFRLLQRLGGPTPTMAEVIRAWTGHGHLHSRGDPFTTLARSIVGQQISVKAANRMRR